MNGLTPPPPGEGGVLPYMGHIGMCGPKGYGFSAALVTNRVSIAGFGDFNLVINRVWFLYSSLDMGMFLIKPRSHFFISIEMKINKSPSQIMFTII